MVIQPELLGRILRLMEAHRRNPPLPAERVQEPQPIGPVRAIAPEIESAQPDARARAVPVQQPVAAEQPPASGPGARVAPGTAAARGGPARDAGSALVQSDVAPRLSPTGRLVAELAGLRSADAAPAGQPVLPDAPVDTARAAAALRESIAASGLFYESHQAEWVNSQRDTATLLREPQGRLSPLLAAAATPDAPPDVGSGTAAATVPARAGPDGLPGQPLHPDAASIVSQQLNALEARHVAWSGEIWPGQPMRWEIGEGEGDRPGSRDEPAERVWSTCVELELPRLGRIAARIVFRASGLTIRLAADLPATDTLVAARAGELGAALAAAGLPVAGIVRSAHGEL